MTRSEFPTLDHAVAHASRIRARVVEVAHVNGALRVNVVLRNGRPQTWRTQR